MVGEMTHWIETLAALPQDPGEIPSTHLPAQCRM